MTSFNQETSRMAASEDIELNEGELDEYAIYEPLISGIRITSGIRAWLTVAMLYRRIIMLLAAMPLRRQPWI